jgi:hypothetical protein
MVWWRRSVLRFFMAVLDGEASYVSRMVWPAGKFTFTSTSLSYNYWAWGSVVVMALRY